jgi:outer membrane lipoprotein carrier protein
MVFKTAWCILAPAFLAATPGDVAQPSQKPAPKVEQTAKATAGTVDPAVKGIVGRMQAFYEKTSDFTGRFTQVYKYKAFKRTQQSGGTVAFKKPGFMRWEYETPSKKTFVLAHERVYTLDPEAKTLTRASMSTNQLSASVTFLWGKGNLADEFNIRGQSCETCKGTLLELTPLKPDPRFSKIRLEVDPQTAQVLRSTVVDPDGSENTIAFESLKPNVGLKPEDFQLEPPPGVQVVDLTQPKQ